jgi:hypothetical protein
MEEDCGGGQGLGWAVEPRRERELLKCPLNALKLISVRSD